MRAQRRSYEPVTEHAVHRETPEMHLRNIGSRMICWQFAYRSFRSKLKFAPLPDLLVIPFLQCLESTHRAGVLCPLKHTRRCTENELSHAAFIWTGHALKLSTFVLRSAKAIRSIPRSRIGRATSRHA